MFNLGVVLSTVTEKEKERAVLSQECRNKNSAENGKIFSEGRTPVLKSVVLIP